MTEPHALKARAWWEPEEESREDFPATGDWQTKAIRFPGIPPQPNLDLENLLKAASMSVHSGCNCSSSRETIRALFKQTQRLRLISRQNFNRLKHPHFWAALLNKHTDGELSCNSDLGNKTHSRLISPSLSQCLSALTWRVVKLEILRGTISVSINYGSTFLLCKINRVIFAADESSATGLWSDLRHLPSLRLLLFGDRAVSHPLIQGPPWSRLHSLNIATVQVADRSVMWEGSSGGDTFFSLICSDSSLLQGTQWKVEAQIRSQHKDLKDFINLSDTFRTDISENEMHYCKNFLPANKSKCRAHIVGNGEGVWEGKSAQNSLREKDFILRNRKGYTDP